MTTNTPECGIPGCKKRPVAGFTLCADHNGAVDQAKRRHLELLEHADTIVEVDADA